MTLNEWLNLTFRWIHVVAGVLWIGQTAFFSWLDSRFTVETSGDGEGEVWMVHSGGFYVVEKQKTPKLLPQALHWFKWEAAFTWLSGISLLLVVYYMGDILVDYDVETSRTLVAAIGLGTLVVGWLVYDVLWISPLGKKETWATLLSCLLAVAVAFGLSQILSGRAAYIHVGALFGTVMAANVWMRILPAQRQLIAATAAGDTLDLRLAARAKQRSKHNTFLAIPVIFIMISNHYPTASYGHRLNWLMLAGFIAVGFLARYAMNHWDRR